MKLLEETLVRLQVATSVQALVLPLLVQLAVKKVFLLLLYLLLPLVLFKFAPFCLAP